YERNPYIQDSVREALASFGNDAYPLITEALSDEKTWTRKSAVLALGRLGDERGALYLVQSLNDEDILVKRASALALTALGDDRGRDLTVELLGDSFEEIRQEAIQYLSTIQGHHVDEFLFKALSDRSSSVREAVTSALEKKGHGKVARTFLNALDSAAARWELYRMKDSRILTPLIDLIYEGDISLKTGALLTLGVIASPGGLEDERIFGVFKGVWEKSIPMIRQAVVSALGDLKDPRGMELLIASLKSGESTDERVDAANSLGKTGDPSVRPDLLAAVEYGHPRLKSAAISALLELGEDSLPLLRKMLSHKDQEVRLHVLKALSIHHDPESLEAIAKLIDDPIDSIRKEAVSSLGNYEEPAAVEALTIALADPDAEIRSLAAVMLKNMGKEELASLVIGALESDFFSLQSLTGSSDPVMLEVFIRALRSNQYVARKGAADTLAVIVPSIDIKAGLDIYRKLQKAADILDAMSGKSPAADTFPEVRESAAATLKPVRDKIEEMKTWLMRAGIRPVDLEPEPSLPPGSPGIREALDNV
ncbi:MAG: HEAT repeat domain-containing protein, partial [Chloroflexi bacterium]|nr:HEAT repeat domain-containing protein [Chloroflexota bacterium]